MEQVDGEDLAGMKQSYLLGLDWHETDDVMEKSIKCRNFALAAQPLVRKERKKNWKLSYECQHRSASPPTRRQHASQPLNSGSSNLLILPTLLPNTNPISLPLPPSRPAITPLPWSLKRDLVIFPMKSPDGGI